MVKVRFSSSEKKRRFSRWLRGRLNGPNNIEPFSMGDAITETKLTHREIYSIINYWRLKSRNLWEPLHKDTESVVRDWETFIDTLNNNHEVFFLVSQYVKEAECNIWFQPDFGEKEGRDNVLLDRHIKGIFTRLDEMALMGETVLATRLPAADVVAALKSYDQKYLRDGSTSPAEGTLLSERVRIYTCPECKTGKMRQMRGNDWRCRECRITIPEDEFNDLIKQAVPG